MNKHDFSSLLDYSNGRLTGERAKIVETRLANDEVFYREWVKLKQEMALLRTPYDIPCSSKERFQILNTALVPRRTMPVWLKLLPLTAAIPLVALVWRATQPAHSQPISKIISPAVVTLTYATDDPKIRIYLNTNVSNADVGFEVEP